MISLGLVVGCSIAAVLFAACAALIVVGNRWRKREESGLYDERPFAGRFVFWGGILAATVIVAISAASLYPYDMEYHRYKHVTGTVDRVEARMLADGEATSQQYAVRYQGTGEVYRCDDSRCSLLRQGDQLELWCIREWQYASTSGWVCRFDKTVPRVAA